MPKIPSHVPTCGGTEVLMLAHCERCNRVTVWLVFRDQPGAPRLCLGHSRKAMTSAQVKRAEAREREALNPRLF